MPIPFGENWPNEPKIGNGQAPVENGLQPDPVDFGGLTGYFDGEG
jgi:hypothetical protein